MRARSKAVRVVVVQAEQGPVIVDPVPRDGCRIARLRVREKPVEPHDVARRAGLRVDVDDRLAAELLAQALRGLAYSGGRGHGCSVRARVEERKWRIGRLGLL